MDIEEIKQKMVAWRDLFGGQILDTDGIQKAKTKEELGKIMDEHSGYIDAMFSDLHSNFSNFRKALELDN